MTTALQYPTEALIRASFENALGTETAYTELLPFFQSLYEMQAAALKTTLPGEIDLAPEVVSTRHAAEMPLVERGEITLDPAAAAALLQSILAAAQSANRQLAASATLLDGFFAGDESRLARCHRMFLDKDRNGLSGLCSEIGIEAEPLDFFLYNSLWPSLASHTRRLSAEYAPNDDWARGYCPICGALPKIAFLSETGRRFLVCRFCRHEWPFERIRCPFCDNKETDAMGYHVNDDDKAHRIDTCDRCKIYIITVDTRRLPRDFYPPLEALVATHLELKAEQMEYRQAIDLNFEDLSPGVW